MLDVACKESHKLRISLINRCKNNEEALAVATAFVTQAAIIYKELGGDRLVATLFYDLADSHVK